MKVSAKCRKYQTLCRVPMFSMPYIHRLKFRCSIFPGYYVARVLYSDAAVILGSFCPRVIFCQGLIFPGPYIPRVLLSSQTTIVPGILVPPVVPFFQAPQVAGIFVPNTNFPNVPRTWTVCSIGPILPKL